MNKNGKEKLITGFVIAIALTFLGIVLYLIFSLNNSVKYPTKPIQQSYLGSTKRRFDLTGLELSLSGDYKIWEVSQNVKKELIDNWAKQIDSSFALTEIEEGSYYYWTNTDETSYLQYSLLRNTLHFKLENGIPWDDIELRDSSFTQFVKENFNREWDYKFNQKVIYPNGSTFFYANRTLPNGYIIETTDLYRETDYLTLQDKKIISGKLLLAEFVDNDEHVPTVGLETLSKVVNAIEYPKSVYFNPGQIASMLSVQEEYLNEELLEIEKEINDCIGVNYQVVYLYTSFDQEVLAPVYKVDLDCSVEYKKFKYSVPGVAYINAIEPEYVTVQK